ncbi:hypothetical protein NPIL_545681 [Nephila pilipes]|uniref:Uncharacterized protein n=1 Tax=Nephila pilipes TaxID=299642 RepID=A0A8X6PMR1_NEPPI|nr:hypothetical protein NPIL_545681 [Nephila pilipes]
MKTSVKNEERAKRKTFELTKFQLLKKKKTFFSLVSVSQESKQNVNKKKKHKVKQIIKWLIHKSVHFLPTAHLLKSWKGFRMIESQQRAGPMNEEDSKNGLCEGEKKESYPVIERD